MIDKATSDAVHAWRKLHGEYLMLRARVEGPALPTDDDRCALSTEADEALARLLLFPAPVGWVLVEKFRLFRALLGPDLEVFTDRREWVFLAALEADAACLSHI